MTIIKNRRFLSVISLAVCCTGIAYSSASHANTPVVTTVLDEAPPPWDGQIRPSSAAAVNSGSARSAGVAEWYQQRQNRRNASGADIPSLQAAANAGDTEALYKLGLLYQSGQGVPADYGKAQQLLERAAKSGHAYAQYALALLYRQSGSAPQIQQSIQWQQKAAQQGHVEAQYGLGMLYANGQHVAKDLHVARHWLQQASQRNHTMAGLALQDLRVAPRPAARPVQRPPARPVQQVQSRPARPVQQAQRPVPQVQHQQPKPMQNSSAYAQYADAPTAPAQPVSALTPAPVVAQQPQPVRPMPRPAAKPMQQVSTVEMQQSQVRLEGKSSDEIRRAAEQGDAAAQMMYGAMFEDGAAGVKQNSGQALHWYRKAARQGYPKAQHNLALLYEDGNGVEQDYRQAAAWYEKAAAAGFSEAQNNLAVLYILGNGVDADRSRAEQLLRQSVAKGNVNAKRNLKMLMNGEG